MRPEYPIFSNSVEGDWFRRVAHFYLRSSMAYFGEVPVAFSCASGGCGGLCTAPWPHARGRWPLSVRSRLGDRFLTEPCYLIEKFGKIFRLQKIHRVPERSRRLDCENRKPRSRSLCITRSGLAGRGFRSWTNPHARSADLHRRRGCKRRGFCSALHLHAV